MRKVSIKLNSRRFGNSKFSGRFKSRKLNSATDLVGQEVEVENGDEVSQATIEEVSVTTDEITLSLDNGDECVLDTNEVEELLEVGEVTSVELDPTAALTPEVEEFNVTRDVIDAEGNINEVTTVVEAVDEDAAVETVKLIDSRRRRNSRNYVVRGSNSRRCNSNSVKFRDLKSEIKPNTQVNLYEFLRDADKDTELFVVWFGAGGSGMEKFKIKVSDILNGWSVARVHKTKYGYVAMIIPDSGSNYDDWKEAKSKLGIPDRSNDFVGSWESNSKKLNSEPTKKNLPSFEIVIGDEKFQIEDGYSQGNYVGADSFGDILDSEADADIIELLENGGVAQLTWKSELDYEDGLRPQINSKMAKRKRINSLTGSDEVAVTKTKGGSWLIATKGGTGISSKDPEVIIEWLVRKINEVCANGVAKNSRSKNSETCNFALISTEDGQNYKVEYLSGRNVDECESVIKGRKAKHKDTYGIDLVATQISDDATKVTKEVMDYLKSHDITDEFVKFEGANCKGKNSDEVEVTVTTEEGTDVEVTESADTLEMPTVEVTETVEVPEPTVAEEVDRESNSFKGVSAFIKRKYGVNLDK